MPKKEPKPECMVCGNAGRYKVGWERTPLCGVHRNQLKRTHGSGFFQSLDHLSRVEVRAAFGFLVLDDRTISIQAEIAADVNENV